MDSDAVSGLRGDARRTSRRLEAAGHPRRELRHDNGAVVRADGRDAALREYRGLEAPSGSGARAERAHRGGGCARGRATSSPAREIAPRRIVEADHPRYARSEGDSPILRHPRQVDSSGRIGATNFETDEDLRHLGGIESAKTNPLFGIAEQWPKSRRTTSNAAIDRSKSAKTNPL